MEILFFSSESFISHELKQPFFLCKFITLDILLEWWKAGSLMFIKVNVYTIIISRWNSIFIQFPHLNVWESHPYSFPKYLNNLPFAYHNFCVSKLSAKFPFGQILSFQMLPHFFYKVGAITTLLIWVLTLRACLRDWQWFCVKEHLLLFQRINVLFSVSTFGNSQSPLTPTPRVIMSSYGLYRWYTHIHMPTHRHTPPTHT